MLTIAIPTYERVYLVSKRLAELMQAKLPESVHVLIVDNGSHDSTYSTLTEILHNSGTRTSFRVLRNEENIHFVGSFIRIFKECNTKYIMFLSDEDTILVEKLPEYLDFLSQYNPQLVSPQAIVKDSIYRGQPVTKKMLPTECQAATFYISGVTFSVKESLPFVQIVENLYSSNFGVFFYPQSTVGAGLLSKYEGYWFASPLTVQVDSGKSHVHETFNGKKSKYNFLEPRCRQFRGHIEYLEELKSETNEQIERSRLDEISHQYARDLIKFLHAAVRNEFPEHLAFFDKGAASFYNNQRPRSITANTEDILNLLSFFKRKNNELSNEVKRLKKLLSATEIESLQKLSGND